MTSTPESTSGVGIYRRLMAYVAPYWKGFALAVLGMVVVASTEASFAALMKPMLDGSFVDRDPTAIRWVPLGILAIFIARGVGGFLVKYYMEWVGRSVIRDLRKEMFAHLIVLPAAFYDNNSKGHITSKLIYDVEQVASAATNAVTILIRDTLTILGLLGWMTYLSWKLTIFFVIVTPLIGVVIVYVSRRFRLISRRIQASMGDVSQITHQVIDNNRVVKIYNGEHEEADKFNVSNEFNRKQHLKMAVTGGVSVPITQFFAALAIVGIMYSATSDPLSEVVTVGTFVSFIAASMLLTTPLKRLTQVNANLQKGIAAAESIFGLLGQNSESDSGKKILDKVEGAILFDNISFAYDENKGKVLENFSLSIEPGQTVAIVGRSGSGKSTIANLLPRFYELSVGKISLDGVPIKDIKMSNLRKHISLVSQEITLFNDTIGNNIAYGQDNNQSKHDLIEAATAAHAMEFINELPDGLDTFVGEKGVLLSGGQRQRVAIARALLKNAPILILDEATSALDTESERFIQDGLNKLMSGKTTLVIAHRLSTIEKADRIIVLEEGKIVEQGTHKELIKLGQKYAALHQLQFK